ncbi:O-methylsterigmatocystin oxidoreductase [Fusarium fujikuroi]|nr:O-methylsterigmatocystin oxidoreductase [Fusarium fujikuroi]
MSTSLVLVTAIFASLSFLLVKHIQRSKIPPLPPGPKGLPFLGNIRDLPPPGTLEWPHWQSHKEKYGPITSVTVLGQRFVILHNRQVIMDLLETRAMKSASRPKLVFAGDIPKSITRFESIQELEILKLLKRLHQDCNSQNIPDHLNQLSGSIMLRILYNYETDPSKSDHIVTMANLVMEEFSQATTPGAWMADFIPWLRHIPDWMPGAGFKKTAKLFRQHLLQNVLDPYQYVKDQMANRKDNVSYVAGLIKDIHRKIDAEEERVIAWTAASMMNAGTDTSGATLLAFFAAMLLNPNVQKKAQEEIDRIIGDSRLPSFSDKPGLPYITAIVQEVLRWHTLAPMGFPHMTTEDDTYRGYFIPKNTLLFPAVASLTHDPQVYHDPMEFKPERYFEPYNEPSPSDLVFGFGRRACPGRWIAEQTLFLSIAQTLAVFEIKKETDGEGNEIEVGYEQLPGVISRVKPFPHRIVLRSEKYMKFLE